jgi:hypothetical protein
MSERNQWEQQGYQDGKLGKDLSLPSTTKTSDGEKVGLALAGLVTGGLAWVFSAMNAVDDSKKTDEADLAYMRGYEDGIKYYKKSKRLKELRNEDE